MITQPATDWAAMPNPKRPQKEPTGRHSWYPFYPGFSNDFASWIIESLANTGSVLLDPWNGSGTTTALAAQRGLGAVGIDLNPAMVVIARTRLLDPQDVDSIRPLSRQILKLAAGRKKLILAEDEPLSAILAHEGAPAVRAIERSIRQLLIDCVTAQSHEHTPDVSRMSPLAAFFYVVLFRVCRTLLQEVGTTNPVWTRLRVPGQAKPRPSMDRIHEVFAAEVERMLASEAEGRPVTRANSPAVTVGVGNSVRLPVPDATINLTLSSPPYCTRVDYAVAMLPELSILGMKREFAFDELRRTLTGTTTVPKDCDAIDSAWGPTCTAFLQAVKAHNSKASAGYYLKSHARYFRDLSASICDLRRVTAPDGTVVLVIQDSHYKEIHNDLPTIAVEMAKRSGFSHVVSRHFPLTRLIAASNPKVRKYRVGSITATESVVVLRA